MNAADATLLAEDLVVLIERQSAAETDPVAPRS
jgi:hypothetical protein